MSPEPCHWSSFIFYHFSNITLSQFLIELRQETELKASLLFVLLCAFCMHGLCRADVTSGESLTLSVTLTAKLS